MSTVIPLDRSSALHQVGCREPRRPLHIVHVVAWNSPEEVPGGLDPRSTYVERFWLPLLGAQATWLVRHLADQLDRQPGGFELDVDEAVRSLGLWGPGGTRSSFRRAVLRAVRHGFVRHHRPGTLAARRRAPTVPARDLARLPSSLQLDHRRWEADRSSASLDDVRRRTRAVALDLLSAEADLAALERRLLGWGVHPSVVAESATWAWERRAEAGGAVGQP
jgi:hypothetical protein